MDELALRPAAELAAAVRSGAVRSRELVALYLERIERGNGALNALVTVDADGPRRRGDERDAERDAGRIRGPLHGVPITVKDAFATAGIGTTSGRRDRIGTGRLALPLVAGGLRVHGVDASADMLDRLRAKPGAASWWRRSSPIRRALPRARVSGCGP